MDSMRDTTDISILDLPDWMRQARKGFDWGILLVIALCLTVSWSFIINPELPRTNASENYVYRTQDTADAIQEGRLYPRWSPHALSGYGAPIPHYYPPGATYAAALLHVLFTGDAVQAVRLTFIIALCLGGSGVYLLVTRRSGALAGLLAAALYVLSPYVGLTTPHILGDMPLAVSLGLLPLLLWSAGRLLLANYATDLLMTACFAAALWLTHPRMALLGCALVVATLIWEQLVEQKRALHPFRVIMALLFGFSLSAFYWLPALVEAGDVRWTLNKAAPVFKLLLGELMTLPQQVDSGTMVAHTPLSVGIMPPLFAALSLIYVLRANRRLRHPLLYLAMALALVFLGLVALPDEHWLLGPVMLCLAVAGSALTHLRNRLTKRWRRDFVPALLIVIWIGSTPVWLSPQPVGSFGSTKADAQVEHEQRGYGVAVLAPGEALPDPLSTGWTPNRFLIDSYTSGSISRIAPSEISLSLQISLLDHASHAERFLVREVTAPRAVTVLLSYFPGWQAVLNGRPLPTRRAQTGLTLVDIPNVPRGNSELALSLEATPSRSGAWAVAAITAGGLLLITWLRLRRQRPRIEEFKLLTLAEARLLALTLACLMLVVLLCAPVNAPLSLRLPPGHSLAGSRTLQVRTDAGLSLSAFRLERPTYQRGDTVDLTLYWQAQKFLAENYRVRLALVSSQGGQRWSEMLRADPGFYATSRWNTQQVVSDSYTFRLPQQMPDGTYAIVLAVEDDRAANLTFFSPSGSTLGSTLTLPILISVRE
ncbi:MAG: glycosyltransferase family 39 protein [Anaerolineae bacterium]|nr:glycosyltransferase family 39 protein [Anaerolineae bacterium]